MMALIVDPISVVPFIKEMGGIVTSPLYLPSTVWSSLLSDLSPALSSGLGPLVLLFSFVLTPNGPPSGWLLVLFPEDLD